MKNRFEEYYKLLEDFLKNDFEFITVQDFYRKNYNVDSKIIILRHDIDSDIKIAKRMFEIEKAFGIKSTYYFRLKTVNKEFMKEIYNNSSEVGYHFEEIATFAKNNNLNTRKDVENNRKNILAEFRKNIEYFKELGFPLSSISSHGDWKNRELGIRNLELINDDLLAELNIIEAYSVEEDLDYRIADNIYPVFWTGGKPEEIIQKDIKKSLILLHPRNWGSCIPTRLAEDFGRLMKK
ncbi:hypothetical protein [Miniphocaeibacter massiliensis]|uniref:hypothetical protein n=1 Tax=Miniphocaeibacter massiliensis TaxID=2041841 RepID=UPI000C1C0E5D|nr:hypothetical protein [Miniphocaeibacter massiliensis]